MASFFAGMTLLEGGTVQDAIQEVKKKFLPTYKVLLLPGLLKYYVIMTLLFCDNQVVHDQCFLLFSGCNMFLAIITNN